MWVNVVGMHHDHPELWSDDVNEFGPEGLEENRVHGGCKRRMDSCRSGSEGGPASGATKDGGDPSPISKRVKIGDVFRKSESRTRWTLDGGDPSSTKRPPAENVGTIYRHFAVFGIQAAQLFAFGAFDRENPSDAGERDGDESEVGSQSKASNDGSSSEISTLVGISQSFQSIPQVIGSL